MNRWIYLFLLIIFSTILLIYIRKRCAVRKVRAMVTAEKLKRINQIAAPLGFEYMLTQDVFTSRTDAWQRECGYCSLYDRHAPFFHMIFDCEPIYFDYENVTWLIEFWKGQYGITSGCEIGIYKADRIIREEERSRTLFHTISDVEMPVFSFTLLRGTLPVCRLCRKHWWLTAFHTGQYSEPDMLSMKISVTFPRQGMCSAFLKGLLAAGYHCSDIYTESSAAAFTFAMPRSEQPGLRQSCYTSWVMLKNRILINVYHRITEPFCFTLDRLLLLYEYLPFLFRYILKLHRTGKKAGERYER